MKTAKKPGKARPDDARYLETILTPIRVCGAYKPKLGQARSRGYNLGEFQDLYRTDPFYSWLGLDNPLMYAAHKAAGGMTSVYRQIGIGCERLFRLCLRDAFGLSEEATRWSYEQSGVGGKVRTLHLDGRVATEDIVHEEGQQRFQAWMSQAAEMLGVTARVSRSLVGTVFEVRQGYKSKDSKRQNADITNAATAYVSGYLPCAVILSSQIDSDVLARYRAEKWMVLIGSVGLNDPMRSTYDFLERVIGYDLAGFFERNQATLRREIDEILRSLLSPEVR